MCFTGLEWAFSSVLMSLSDIAGLYLLQFLGDREVVKSILIRHNPLLAGEALST